MQSLQQKSFTLLLLSLFSLPIQSQNFFQKTYGTKNYELANDVLPLADGYLLAAETFTDANNADAVLLRTDLAGAVVWQRNFGSPAGFDRFVSVEQAGDGGFVAWGTFQDTPTAPLEARFIKTDAAGKIVWEKTLRKAQSDYSATGKIVPVAGGFLVNFDILSYQTGGNNSNVAQFSDDGSLLWSGQFGSFASAATTTYLVHFASDTLFVCGGSDNRAGIYFLKQISNDSLSLHFQTWDGGNREIFTDIAPTRDGNLLLCGITQKSDVETQVILRKIWRNGLPIWTKKWEITSWAKHNPQLETTADGGFLLLTDNVVGDAQLTRLDAAGNPVWDRNFGGPGFHILRRVRETADGGWVVAGMTSGSGQGSGEIFLAKIDAAGLDPNCEPEATKIFVESNYTMTTPAQFSYGYVQPNLPTENGTTPSNEQTTLVAANFCKKPIVGTADFSEKMAFDIFPNPAGSVLNLVFSEAFFAENLDCTVSDLAGRVALFQKLASGSNTFSLDVESLPAGAFWVRAGGFSRLFFKI